MKKRGTAAMFPMVLTKNNNKGQGKDRENWTEINNNAMKPL